MANVVVLSEAFAERRIRYVDWLGGEEEQRTADDDGNDKKDKIHTRPDLLEYFHKSRRQTHMALACAQ